jgi:hypothetical protein
VISWMADGVELRLQVCSRRAKIGPNPKASRQDAMSHALLWRRDVHRVARAQPERRRGVQERGL